MAYSVGTPGAFFKMITSKGFTGNKRIKTGRPRFLVKSDTGAPAVAAPIGTLCYVVADADTYRNTDGSTTWTKIVD